MFTCVPVMRFVCVTCSGGGGVIGKAVGCGVYDPGSNPVGVMCIFV